MPRSHEQHAIFVLVGAIVRVALIQECRAVLVITAQEGGGVGSNGAGAGTAGVAGASSQQYRFTPSIVGQHFPLRWAHRACCAHEPSPNVSGVVAAGFAGVLTSATADAPPAAAEAT